MIFEKSSAYWVDNHANVIPVPTGLEHVKVSEQRLGKNVNPYAVKWVRVTVDGEYGVMFDYKDYPSPSQLLSLREIADEHGMPLFDVIKRRIVEYRHNSARQLLNQLLG